MTRSFQANPAEGETPGFVSNCANLQDGPPTDNPILQPRPMNGPSDGLQVDARPRTQTCSPSGACTWDVTVTNVSNVPFTGPMQIDGSAILATPTAFDSESRTELKTKPVSGEGLVCNNPQDPGECTLPSVTIPPGQSKTVSVTTTPTIAAGSQASVLVQSFDAAFGEADATAIVPVVLDPPVGAPAASPSELAALSPRQCVLGLVPAAPKPPKLVISKLKQGGGDHCPVNGPCLFQIVVTNTGGSDFKGPVEVHDFLPGSTFSPSGGGAPVSTVAQSVKQADGSSPGWNCSPSTNELRCKQDEVTIPKNGFIRLMVEVVAGDTWKNAHSNELENCANLSAEGVSSQPTEEKHSCRTVKLDPFDVKVAKTGGQSCQPGKECKFELDIFNPGNIRHDDPVTVSDKLTGIGNAQIVSLTPVSSTTAGVGKAPDAFPCTPPPTEAPFTCTGRMKLDVGEHNKYEVVIRIPDDAPTSGAFTNCAGVGKDAAASTPGATDDVCHTTKLEPPGLDSQCPEGWTGTYPNCNPPQVSGGPNSAVKDPVANCASAFRRAPTRLRIHASAA
ncbi:MAG: hypothetical protein WDN31_22485 [Hyphomicrobium sp.]